MGLRHTLKTIRKHGLFYGEKLVSDANFVEKPVPEYPAFMKQPVNAPSAWYLKPIEVSNPRSVDLAAIGILLLASGLMYFIA